MASPIADKSIRKYYDVFCIGPIIIQNVYNYLGISLNGLIGTHPLLLSLLRGTVPAIVVTGAFARIGRVPLVLALLAPLLISVIFDPFYFWAGRRYGRRLFDYLEIRYPRSRKKLHGSEQILQHYGLGAVLIAPFASLSSIVALFAGEAGMPFRVFILADIIGNQIENSLLVLLGWKIGQPAVNGAQEVSRYALLLFVITVLLIVGYNALSINHRIRKSHQ